MSSTTPTPRRILLCGSSLEGGGSERQLLNLLRGLDHQRYQPELYLLYRSGPLLQDVPQGTPIVAYWDRHQPLRPLWPGREHLRQVVDLTRHLRRSRAAILYERVLHMSMIAGPAARRAGVPRVSTLVSPPSRDLPQVENRLRWLKRWLLARSYRQADALLAVSQATADDAAQYYGLDPDRIRVVPSPIDLQRIDRLAKEPMVGDWDSSRCHVGVFGRLSQEKGQSEMLQAFARWRRTLDRPATLHLVGEGPMQVALEELGAALGLQGSLVFHGFQSNPYSRMSRCDWICIPSWYEGLPNVLLEAMACGVPVVATHASASMHQILFERFGVELAKPGNVDSLVDRLQWASQHREAYLAKLPAMRSYIEQHHGLTRWLEGLQQLFDEVIERRRTV